MEQQNNQEWKNILKEEVKEVLAKLKEMSVLDLAAFDVRDYEFRRVVKELCEDFKIYNSSCSNVVVKTAIGKKLATLDFDYDVSLFSNCIYWLAMFQNESSKSVCWESGYEYKIKCGEKYRGDTMNSWATTLDKFSHVRSWKAFLGDSYHGAQFFPEYITVFMNNVYTIGNFFPLPDGLNGPRGTGASQDYWDLALLCIYNYYMKTDDKHTLKWLLTADQWVERCAKWLDSFDSWNDFVEKTYMQDFVNYENGVYGAPKELWKGHFKNTQEKGALPVEDSDFSEFFTNASCWIMARGIRIANAVKKRLMEEDMGSLVSRMINF